MLLVFNNETPIYMQIINQIKLWIFSGKYKMDDKLPSVRELASEINVNPNTIQRAFYELEKEGLIKTEKTIGRRVTTNQSLILKEKRKLAKAKTKQYVQDMVGLGISKEELIKYLKEEIENGNSKMWKFIKKLRK